jgi:hypothetical protein
VVGPGIGYRGTDHGVRQIVEPARLADRAATLFCPENPDNAMGLSGGIIAELEAGWHGCRGTVGWDLRADARRIVLEAVEGAHQAVLALA